MALAGNVTEHATAVAVGSYLTCYPNVLNIAGLAEGRVAQIACQDTCTAGTSYIGILYAQVANIAAKDTKQAAVVICSFCIGGEVADNMTLTVEVDERIAI